MLLELRKSRMPKLLSKKPNNQTLPSPFAPTACFNAAHSITLSAVPPSSSSKDTTSSLTIAIDNDQERRREQGRLPLLVPPRLRRHMQIRGQLLSSKSNQTKPSLRLSYWQLKPLVLSAITTHSTCWRFYFRVAEGGNTEKLGKR